MVLAGSVLAVMVTVLFCLFFCFPGLYTTFISPVPPGAMGSLGYSGTVQPHEPFAFSIINGSLPVLVNVKILVFSESCKIEPKSTLFSANWMFVSGPFGFVLADFSGSIEAISAGFLAATAFGLVDRSKDALAAD